MIAHIPINFPDIDILVQGTNLKADKIRLLLHQLFLSRLRQTGYKPKWQKRNESWRYIEGYVPLKSVILADLLSKNYSHYLNFLENKGLIRYLESASSRRAYTPGTLSIHYKIPDEYFHKPLSNRHFRKEEIKDACTIRAIDRVNNRYPKNEHKGLALKPVHQKLIEMEKTIRFDIPSAETWIQAQTEKVDWMQIELLEAINNGYFTSTLDMFGERLHTPLKRIMGELRNFMYFEGYENSELVTIDICNSQLYFSALLAHPEIITRFLPEFNPVMDIVKEQAFKEDFLLYSEKSQTGTIYEYWKEIRNKKNRDIAKMELFGVLFGENSSKRKGAEEFAKIFPSVDACFRRIKSMTEEDLPFIKTTYADHKDKCDSGRYHRNLSCLTQRLESRIFLKHISSVCIEKDAGPFVTIHDSIMCLKEKRSLVEQIINNEFARLLLQPPTFKPSKGKDS